MTNTTKTAFTWAEFENGKLAVVCEKKPLAKLFLKWCGERGYKWNNGGKSTKTEYIEHATFPIRFVHNFNDVNDLSFSDWPLANFPEVNLADILTIRESEPAPEPPKFSWEKFKTEKIAVNCKSGKEIVRFLGMCMKKSMLWKDGDEINIDEGIDDRILNIQDTTTCIYYEHSGIDIAPAIALPKYIYTIIDSTTVPDLKYRPFRELKADLIGRVVRQKKYHSKITMITQVNAGWFRLGDSGSQYKASGGFDLLEFLDPKTGATSPCGEVDCE